MLTSNLYHHTHTFLPTCYPGFFPVSLSELLDHPKLQSWGYFEVSFNNVRGILLLGDRGKKKLLALSFWLTLFMEKIYLIYSKFLT